MHTTGAEVRYTVDGTVPTCYSGTLYSNPLEVSNTTTIMAVGCKSGWDDSDVASAVCTITDKVAAPAFNLDSGTYSSDQSVELFVPTSNASIRYTIDGSSPNCSSGVDYSGALTVTKSTTFKAIGCRTDLVESDIALASYILLSASLHVATSGDDTTGDGSEASPYGTIAKALESAVSGDVVGVHAGTYQEAWLRMKDGIALISADGPLAAVIDSGTKSVLRVEEVSGVLVDGFEIHGDWNQGAAVDGLIRVWNADNVVVRNGLFDDAPYDADVIKVSGSISNLLIENVVAWNPAERQNATDCEGACFQEVIDIFGSGTNHPPVSDVVVRGCWLFHTENTGDWLIYSKIYAENILHENNIFGPSAGLGWGNPAVGIGTSEGVVDSTPDVTHAIVRNNVFVGLKGDAALAVMNSDDVWAYNNVFYANGGEELRAVVELQGNTIPLGLVRVFNNVFQNNHPTKKNDGKFYRVRGDLPTTFFHGYNIYSDNVSQSDASYKWEFGSLYNSDPLLAAPAVPSVSTLPTSLGVLATLRARFSPSSNSPALNTGLDAGSQTEHPDWSAAATARSDIGEGARPALNKWDMGIYECDPDDSTGDASDHFGAGFLESPRLFEVGPGKTYSRIVECPTFDLRAGEEIHVYHKPTPYNEKFLLLGAGTADNPVVLKGIPDAGDNKHQPTRPKTPS
ncbi:MAG: DUF1565 domain-containing protein [Proteobacteria bacterium]|nr:DUF1565 domain-containing protein [Pseudomonadota bacterium]